MGDLMLAIRLVPRTERLSLAMAPSSGQDANVRRGRVPMGAWYDAVHGG